MKKKIRINILAPRFGGPHYIGKKLAEELNKRGFEAKFICDLKGLLLSPFYQDCDIIHSMDIPIFFKLWKKPYILSVHGEYPIQKNLWRFFYPRAIRLADKVITPSKFLKEQLGLKQAVVIPNAIDTNEFKPVKHSDKGEINIITVTSFYFRKKAEGVLKLIKIISSVSEGIEKRISYTIVGGGPYLRQIKKKAQDSKLNINFTGFVTNPKKLLGASDIFAYYSEHESFGIILLEAMASGLPIVVNKYGPFSEIILDGENGFIAETEGDYEDDLIHLLANFKFRKRIGINARQRVENIFDWSNVIRIYLSIYNTLHESNYYSIEGLHNNKIMLFK